MINLFKKYFRFMFKTWLDMDTLNNYRKNIEEFERCMRDPIEFKDTCFQDISLVKNAILNFNSKQLFLADSFVNKQKIIIKAKNYSEITQIQVLLIAWLMYFNENYKVGVIVANSDLAKTFIKDLDNIFYYLNNRYKLDAYFEKTNSTITLSNNSHCVVRTSRSVDTNGLFRGIKLNSIFYNEASRLQSLEEIYNLFTKQYNPEYSLIFDIHSNPPINPKSKEFFETLYQDSDLHPIDIT